MGFVVAQEASRLQSITDEEVLLDAQAIAEAEMQRSRVDDRLRAALGRRLYCHLPGITVQGMVREVGAEILVLDSEVAAYVISRASVLSLAGLPHALRFEGDVAGRVTVTWSAMLREWAQESAVQFTMCDGECLSGVIEAVGADFVDVRHPDGNVVSLMLTGVRFAVRPR